jgi:hypothetical protein
MMLWTLDMHDLPGADQSELTRPDPPLHVCICKKSLKLTGKFWNLKNIFEIDSVF